MIHLNGNLLCVIDCETTGLNPMQHYIWQFTCLPLDFRLDPHKDVGPFDILLCPPPDDYDTNAISKKDFVRAKLHGLPYETGANLFHEWFERLPLGFKKRICVLAHNWPFDREFTKMWLGNESFEYYFDPRYRDTMVLASAINDSCDFRGDQAPFPWLRLRQIANELEIEWDDRLAHNSFYDTRKTIEIYKKLLQRMQVII